jgi:hypothetical protein
VPTVFNLHYLGTMDYWDPAVTDGLARDREVILFNNGRRLLKLRRGPDHVRNHSSGSPALRKPSITIGRAGIVSEKNLIVS